MDFAIYSAKIFTGDPDKPWAEALAVQGDKIVAVGSNDEVKVACPAGAKSYDLAGKFVTPGLVDAHCHFVHLGQSMTMVNLVGTESIEECRDRIMETAKNKKPGEWIIGRGWNHTYWPGQQEPSKADLDDILPDNPAMMIRACGHSIWVNSKALEAAKVTKDTPEPPGGAIDRDPATGEPTGMVREARHIFVEAMPEPTHEQRVEMALAAQEAALKSGLTGVHTCENLDSWAALNALDKEGKLKIRVHQLIQGAEIEEARKRGIKPGDGTTMHWFGQIKLFADGSLGAGTAYLHEPYTDEPDNSGLAFVSLEDLTERVTAAYKDGWSVAIHAIGDKAVSNCLDAYAAGRKAVPGEYRDSVEHVQLITERDIDRFKEMGVVASVQPVFVQTDWHVAQRRWGEERCQRAYIWKTLLDRGVRCQYGSDSPVEPIDVRRGLSCAMTRQDAGGQPDGGWNPPQKLTLEQTIDGFTKTAAYTARRENEMGAIKPGMLADLTVYGQDLSQVDPADWPGVDTAMTIVNGEVVYEA